MAGSCVPCPRAGGVQGWRRQGAKQEVLQGRCCGFTVAPSPWLPWESCRHLSPGWLLLGHPLLSSHFAARSQAGLIRMTVLPRKGVNDGPWPSLDTSLGAKPRLMKVRSWPQSP